MEAIRVEDLQSVYSGKWPGCCCGCNGKHRYRSAVAERGTELRGYPVQSHEVNDVTVRRLVNKINAAIARGVPVYLDESREPDRSEEAILVGGNNVAYQTGAGASGVGRIVIAYYLPEARKA